MDKKIHLTDRNGNSVPAVIKRIAAKDMPYKKQGWKFDWRDLSKNSSSEFFALITDQGIEGLIELEAQDQGNGHIMMVMHHVEIADRNKGKKGLFKDCAGALFAFGCLYSALELEKSNNYFGFLVFSSKAQPKLINNYLAYGATQFNNTTNMWFDPDVGDELIKTYLSG